MGGWATFWFRDERPLVGREADIRAHVMVPELYSDINDI